MSGPGTLAADGAIPAARLVRAHYEPAIGEDDLLARVTRAVDAMDGPVTTARLAGFDQFHVRGLAATAELGGLLGVQPGAEVLDAGSGLGGPSRHMAETYGCKVTGVDLAPSYVAVARLLAERTGLDGAVAYEAGDLLALRFPDGRFDAAYTQHVVMNIRDRDRVYGELRRVLKPEGRFAFYDVLAADERPEPLYPVPWAEGAETSVLLTEGETRAALDRAGLIPDVWNDVTAEAVAWFAQQRPPSAGAPSLATVMGPRFGQMAANLARNLTEGRLRLVMAGCSAAPAAR